MIIGRFNDQGRPHVRGRLFIPRLDIDLEIDFLLETGADSTCLHPGDLEYEIAQETIGRAVEATGVGGTSRYFEETAVVFFEDETALRSYVISLYIAEPIEHLPSVLGRDIINQWRMVYDPANDMLEFTVRTADAII